MLILTNCVCLCGVRTVNGAQSGVNSVRALVASTQRASTRCARSVHQLGERARGVNSACVNSVHALCASTRCARSCMASTRCVHTVCQHKLVRGPCKLLSENILHHMHRENIYICISVCLSVCLPVCHAIRVIRTSFRGVE